MIRNEQGTGVQFTGTARTHDATRFVPLACPKGSCVVLHGSYVHMSKENTSDMSRHAYSLHFVEGDGAEYPKDNWYALTSHLSPLNGHSCFVSLPSFSLSLLSSPSLLFPLSSFLFLSFSGYNDLASDPFHSI